MYFALNKDQEMFRSSIKRYLQSKEGNEIARNFSEKQDERLYQEVWKQLADLGVMSLNITEAYGGTGLQQIDLVPAYEETGNVLLPGLLLETTAFFTPIIHKFGTEAQKETYLRKVATGELIATIALLETPSHLAPHANRKMKAVTKGGEIRLNGEKSLVVFGDKADIFIVLARNEMDEQSLFIVDRNLDGISIEPLPSVDHTRKVANLSFKDVTVSADERIGKEGAGLSIIEEGLLHLHAAISASMLGSMEAIVETASTYANTREQFGQPIGTYQAIKHKIVDMKVDLETAKSLTYYANWAVEHDVADRGVAVYSARAFTTEAFLRSAEANIQIHGGIGFTKEIDCHLYVKRARAFESYLGTVNEFYSIISEGLGW